MEGERGVKVVVKITETGLPSKLGCLTCLFQPWICVSDEYTQHEDEVVFADGL